MRMRAAANDTDKQLGKRVTQRYKRRDRCKNIAATIAQGGPPKTTTWGKTGFVCPSTSRPPKESFDIRPLTDERPARSKSNRLRIEPSTGALFAMFTFFTPSGVRGFPFI